MNTEVFDGIARELGGVSTRRSFVRLLGGAAAVGAGVVLGSDDIAAKKKRKKKKTGGGNNGGTGGTGGGGTTPVTCTQLILSGGPNPSDKIVFDDDGSILNTTKGQFILIDNDGRATEHAARFLDASLGDLLRVRVTDWSGCRSLSPLWVHCAGTGQSKQIFSGYNGGRCDYPKQSDFLDFVIKVEL